MPHVCSQSSDSSHGVLWLIRSHGYSCILTAKSQGKYRAGGESVAYLTTSPSIWGAWDPAASFYGSWESRDNPRQEDTKSRHSGFSGMEVRKLRPACPPTLS